MATLSFARRQNAGAAEDSICLRCFLTVSTVKGGANLRLMERLHKCDPINLFYCQNTPTGTAHIRRYSV
jgi:hypothetical protein